MRELNYLARNQDVVADFDTSIYDFIYSRCKYVSNVEKHNKWLDRLIKQSISNGLFFRNCRTRRACNYWQPLSNAGVPAVPRGDYIHELTFFMHDILHNAIPDVQITGRSRLDKKVYVIERMMGEGINLILADMYFIDTLFKSGVDYDFSDRKIYQALDALDGSLYENILGNVMYCITGDSSYFKLKEGKEDKLDLYLNWYRAVYISDLKWTLHNLNSILSRANNHFKWVEDYKDVLPTYATNDKSAEKVITTGYLIEKLKLNDELSIESLVLRIFNYIWDNILNYDGEISLDEAITKEKAKTRCYAYQAKLAYDYSLDKMLYKHLVESKSFAQFDTKYKDDLMNLHSKRMINDADYELYCDVYAHYTPYFISYSDNKVEEISLKDYARDYIFEVL